MLDNVATELYAWVDDLKCTGQSQRNGFEIIAAAERIKSGLESTLVEELAETVSVDVLEPVVSVDFEIISDNESIISLEQIESISQKIKTIRNQIVG